MPIPWLIIEHIQKIGLKFNKRKKGDATVEEWDGNKDLTKTKGDNSHITSGGNCDGHHIIQLNKWGV